MPQAIPISLLRNPTRYFEGLLVAFHEPREEVDIGFIRHGYLPCLTQHNPERFRSMPLWYRDF
jgi:hypothetical protein